jgi:hypothetical protein
MLIGFNALGRMGRLGNQMFQYAALKGIASMNGAKYQFPIYRNAADDGIGNMVRTELFDVFRMDSIRQSNIGILKDAPLLCEQFFHFDERLFRIPFEVVEIRGFFQSERYFMHIKHEIFDDFRFSDEVMGRCLDIIGRMDKPISLHVRRQDYVHEHSNHPPCSEEYYRKAILRYENDRRIIVFSDDPEWCRNQALFSEKRFLVFESGDQRTDLCLMTLCSDHIIANSSFSWWGAWLSRNPLKTVIAPKRWFGEGYTKDLNTQDLYPEGWQVE